ncbi:MAG: hypothetical protein IJQ80_03585, partial [Clostridia bacterium]|nr:hypothetical protein [Clostridia bacterium]
YKTTKASGSILNRKPDWSQATSLTVEIKLYYTATCSVSGCDDGEMYLNGEAVDGEVRLYLGEEYTFTAKTVDEYVYTLVGAEDGVAFRPSSDMEVSAVYIKDAYATVTLSVCEGGTAVIVSDGNTITEKVPEGSGFSVEATPDAAHGYYVDSIVITKGGEVFEGSSVEAVADGEAYEVSVTFGHASIALSDMDVSYIAILDKDFAFVEDEIKSAVAIEPAAFAEGATYEVKYLSGTLLGDAYENLDYSSILPTRHSFGASSAYADVKIGNTETVRVICTNEAFPGVTLTANATATVVDMRIPTQITADQITVTYGDDLKTAVCDAIAITGDDGLAVEFTSGDITVNPSAPQSASQDVTVKFAGTHDYAPSEAVFTVSVDGFPYSLNGSAVKFYDTDSGEISEAPSGQTVTVRVDPDAIPAGYYFAGSFESDDVEIAVNENCVGSFTMQDHEVTVNAVFAEQESYALEFTNGDAVQLPIGMAGVLSLTDKFFHDEALDADVLDLNGDGAPDLQIDLERGTVQRLPGSYKITESVTLDLAVPGIPYRYGSVTITFVFYLGDLTGDGKITSKDISLMKRVIAGSAGEGAYLEMNADMDGDGKINSKDISRLKRLVASGGE